MTYDRGEGGFLDEYASINNLHESTRGLLDTLLGKELEKTDRKWIDRQREEATDKLAMLPDKVEKKSVAAYLAKRLGDWQNGSKRFEDSLKDWHIRSWVITALAKINEPSTIGVVTKHIDPRVEEHRMVRYWAVVRLPKILKSKELKSALEEAIKDDDELVQCVSRRLLIENGFDSKDQSYLNKLYDMVKSKDRYLRWVACRALRRETDEGPLQLDMESIFFNILVERLHDDNEVLDVKWDVIKGLGNMRYESKKAIMELSSVLKNEENDFIRRGCVNALHHIKKPESKDALLFALHDADAENRLQAADALKDSLGGAINAVKIVVDEYLRHNQPTPEYEKNIFDTLRRIDEKESARVLSEKLLDPNPDISKRARDALTRLGGEEAVRILQVKRTEALDKYTELLKNTDKKIMLQHDSMMDKVTSAFSLTMYMNGIIFSIGVVVLVYSMYVAFSAGFETFERYVGTAMGVSSLTSLLVLFYKDPLKNIYRSVTNLVRINVVFLGYVRQINQIDATFKQMFLAPAGFGIEQMKETVVQIQDSVNKTMDEVKKWIELEAKEAKAEQELKVKQPSTLEAS